MTTAVPAGSRLRNLSLKQILAIIGIAIFAGALYGIPNRETILSGTSPNPNDFTSLFLSIFQTTALIDFLASLPIVGLLFIGTASQSFAVLFGVIVLDHKTIPTISLLGICLTGTFEITAQIAAGVAGFRLANFYRSKHPDEGRKTRLYTYLKLLGIALSISCLSALFETASILGMLPFGI